MTRPRNTLRSPFRPRRRCRSDNESNSPDERRSTRDCQRILPALTILISAMLGPGLAANVRAQPVSVRTTGHLELRAPDDTGLPDFDDADAR